jgi:glycosyltransferase involved in cell wall biosynthesis
MNIPLGTGLTEFIGETDLPSIAHHHDFSWERDRFIINACKDFLDMAFPPDLPSIRHVVINSLASIQLSHRLKISSTIIPNVYDYARKSEDQKNFRRELRAEVGIDDNEVFILQPTRIVPRKCIERSIEIVKYLKLSNPKLVISHASGDEGDDYYQKVMEYADSMGVRIIHISHLINGSPPIETGGYTIADLYNSADLVTYPSRYEGFGNAFLEAIYFKKPIVLNRYPVYITDIEPKGFDVIAFDDTATNKTIKRIERTLVDNTYRKKLVDRNFKLAKQFFSYELLENKLLALIQSFD